MDRRYLNNLLFNLKNFLIEKKNQKIFFLGITFFILLIITGSFFIVFSIRQISDKKLKKAEKSLVFSSPTEIPKQNNKEEIQSIGYSIDCRLIIHTSSTKRYLKKLDKCNIPLNYLISQSKSYLVYLLNEKDKASMLFIYSLENNIEGQLQIVSKPVIDWYFDKHDNLSILFADSLVYYFIPRLFSEYPDNYYSELKTFTNIEKNKIEISLPETKNPYAKILEQKDRLDIVDNTNKVLFTILFADLERQLSPTVLPSVNRTLLKWDKRILYYSHNEFRSMDIDSSNEFSHQFICDGVEVVPIGFHNHLIARSPDGATIAFLIPTEVQMRDHPSWKEDLLNGKKIFEEGEIVLYDLITDRCQKTGLIQSIKYRENFSFSPNGLYLAFVNKGIGIYILQNHQDHQLVNHNPDIESDSTVVTGPLVWDGESRFIYTLVSKINNNTISSTNLVRIYFNENFEGTEQEIMPVAENTLFTVSPDGSKLLYIKDRKIYKYDINRKLNSLFSNNSVEKINKLIWLRNGMIISNIWYANENLYFSSLPEMENFHIDFNGELIIYGSNPILLYDLNQKKQRYFLDKKKIEGFILPLFY